MVVKTVVTVGAVSAYCAAVALLGAGNGIRLPVGVTIAATGALGAVFVQPTEGMVPAPVWVLERIGVSVWRIVLVLLPIISVIV
jgi:hypothetical protein